MIKSLALLPIMFVSFCSPAEPITNPQPKPQGVKPVTESPQPTADGDKLDRMEAMLVTLVGGQQELKQLSKKQIEATEDSTTAIVLAIRESKPDFSELIAAIKPPMVAKAITPVAEQPVDDKPKAKEPQQQQQQQQQFTYRTETRYRTAYRLEQRCFGSYCQMVNVPYQQAYQVQVKVDSSDVVPVPDDGGNQPAPQPQPQPIDDGGGSYDCPPIQQQPRLFQGRVIQRIRNTWQFFRNVRGAMLNRRVMRFNLRG